MIEKHNPNNIQLEWTSELEELIVAALNEDIGPEDITTRWIVPQKLLGKGEIIAKAEGILCGTAIAERIWQSTDAAIRMNWLAFDGDAVMPGETVATMHGPMRGLLTGERVALNFLQRLSGIATLTARFCAAVGPSGPIICDTRKTTPLLRFLERYAVRAGGGVNHRLGLFDMVLIKENHARAAGGLRQAIQRAYDANAKCAPSERVKIAAEASNPQEVGIACEANVDLILLDNFTPQLAAETIAAYHGRSVFEISGGVNLDNIEHYAQTGVDRISIGALTHSAPVLDLSAQLYSDGE